MGSTVELSRFLQICIERDQFTRNQNVIPADETALIQDSVMAGNLMAEARHPQLRHN